MAEPKSLWAAYQNLPPESPGRITIFALCVALLSALAVSVAAFALRPAQQANIEAERRAQIERILAAAPGLEQALFEADYNRLEMRIVDLRLGFYARGVDAEHFDPEAAAADPNLFTFIESVDNFAGISRRPDLRPVYLAYKHDALALLVLPVYGSGVQSSIEGYVALKKDLNTLYALVIADQEDSPEGAGIADPEWLRQWQGKRLRDQTRQLRLDVVPGGDTGLYTVAPAPGAETSSERVAQMVRFWLGDHGFGPYLARLDGS